jgi:hypothetical protein
MTLLVQSRLQYSSASLVNAEPQQVVFGLNRVVLGLILPHQST